jgi:hypothetical protein
MKARKLWAVGALVLAIAVGAVGGTALAGGGATINGTGAKSTVSPQFSSSAAIKLRAAAVINADGTLMRSSVLPSKVVSTVKLSTGVYDVRFSKPITGCAWFGTIGFGSFSGSTGPSGISVTGRAGTNNGLFVQTFQNNAIADAPFAVQVVC